MAPLFNLQYYAHAEAAIPLRRVGTCEDHIVPLIMFMASDKATFINGAVIVADGGYSHTCNCPWICGFLSFRHTFSLMFNVMYVSINTIYSYTWVLTICLFFWHPFLLCKRTCTHAHAHAYTKQTLHPILQSCKKIFWSAIDLPMWPIYNTIRANALVQLWCNFCESKWNPYWISMFMNSSSNNYFLSEHEDIDQYGPYVMPSERMLCNCYTVSLVNQNEIPVESSC